MWCNQLLPLHFLCKCYHPQGEGIWARWISLYGTPLDAHGWYCHIHNFKMGHGANISITHGNYSSPAYVMSSYKVKIHDCQHK